MRYFIGFLITIGLIIVLIVLLFSGGDNKQTSAPEQPKTLVSYADTDTEVRMTIDGPTNANQVHQQVVITVGRDNTDFELLQGYQGSVVNAQSFANNQESYANFLRALSVAGYNNGDTDKALADERGYCSLGSRFIFEIINNGKTVQRFWTTTCGKPKTYLGEAGLTIDLFEAQVPEYNELTEDFDQ